MRFRHPLIIILAVGILASATVTSLIFVEAVKKQNRNDRRVDVTRLLEAVRSWSEMLNRSLGDRLNHILENEWNSPEPTPAFLGSEFQALALMTQGESGNWNVDWWRSRVTTLDQAWVQQQFKDSQWLSMRGREVYWERLVLPGGQVIFAIAAPMTLKENETVKSKVAIGFTTPGLFSMSQFANSGENGGEIFVVDQKGNAVGYPEAQYVGSKIDSHPLVNELLKTPAAQKVHEYSTGEDKKSVGGYEHVTDSNLYVVSSYPLQNTNDLISSFMMQALAVILGLVALVAFIAAFILGREWREKKILEQNLAMSGHPVAAALTVTTPNPRVEALQNSKLAPETVEFARSISEFLRVPVTALLGYVQMLEDHLTSPGSIALAKQLTEETRTVRDFVETMSKEAMVPEQRLEAVQLQTLLASAVAMKKPDFTKAQISLEENFQTDVRVKADFVRLKASLLVLLNYAGEFLSETPSGAKRIVLTVEKMGGVVALKIEVRGRELPGFLLKKLFLPFQVKTKLRAQMGIDLALVRTRVQDMHGEITAEAIGLEGFRVVLKMPTAAEGMVAVVNSMGLPTAPGGEAATASGNAAPTEVAAGEKEKPKSIPLPKDFQQIRTDIKFTLEEKLVDPGKASQLPPTPEEVPPTFSGAVTSGATVTSISTSPETSSQQIIRKPKVGSDS